MKEFLKKIFRGSILYEIALKMRLRYCAYVRKRKISSERREIMRNYNPSIFYLNIGSRLFVRKNWRLLDYTGNHSYKVGDRGELLDFDIDLIACRKFPLLDNSVDLLFSSHCLEHIGDAPAQNIFNEAYRLLKQGGVFRVSLPDADLFYDTYKRNDIAWFRGITRRWKPEWPIEMHYFKYVSARYMGTVGGVRKNVQKLSKEAFFEKYHKEIYDSNDNVSGHITWFNHDKVKRMAEKAGFTDIRLSSPHQSVSEEMRAPEFDKHEKFSLYVDIVR